MLGAVVGVTVIVTALDVAVVVVAQATFDVNTQVTTSLFDNVVDPNVAELVPTFPPFTFHWYTGVVPPLVGVAVNNTEVLAQTLLLLATIETEGVTTAFTIVTSLFDVVLFGTAQDELEVTTHQTVSLFAKPDVL
jgi:hypothetical protein